MRGARPREMLMRIYGEYIEEIYEEGNVIHGFALVSSCTLTFCNQLATTSCSDSYQFSRIF